jgi:hypothetical protein
MTKVQILKNCLANNQNKWKNSKTQLLTSFPESADILIFSKKNPALRTRLFPETCLEQSFGNLETGENSMQASTRSQNLLKL